MRKMTVPVLTMLLIAVLFSSSYAQKRVYTFQKKKRKIVKHLEFHVSPVVPSGHLSDIAEPGAGIGIRFLFNLADYFALSAGWDYDRFGEKTVGKKTVSNKYSPFRFGPVLYFPVSNRFKPFVNADACFFIPLGHIHEESFGYSGGIGSLIQINNLTLSIAAKISQVAVDPTHRYFNINAGILFQVFGSRGVY